jgi:B12-binding domain/radical SAM domain protein
VSRCDVIFLHAPSVYDFRKKPIFYGPVSDVIPSSPVFEMYPVGFMTISSHLEAAGFRTRIANIAVQMLADERFDAERKIKGLDADVFAIDLHWMPHAHGALELAKIVKKHHPDAKVELGGFTSSYFHEELIARPEVDLVMRGDTTEVPTVMMMEALQRGGDLSEVPNLTWKDGSGKVRVNPLSYSLKSLDEVIFDYGTMIKCTMRNMDIKGALPWHGWDRIPLTSVFTVRGCSVNCAECGGSHYANARVACRKAPAFRSPERLADDMEMIQSYFKAPVFIVGDLRQGGMGYADRFLEECRSRRIRNHVVVELFNGATPEYFQKLDKAFEGGWSIEFSPDSHDEKVRFALGKGYTNENIEKTVAASFRNGCSRFDLFYMNGLPFQDRDSALDSARAAERLWASVRREDRLFIYNAPFAPFVDPGSRAFEEPEKWGYRLRARTLEDHRRLLDSPSWKHVLSYETEWMSRDDVAEVSYDAAQILAEKEFGAGRISEEEYRGRRERTEIARDLMHKVDAILEIEDPEEREARLWETKDEGVRMMDSTVCNKKDLDWEARPVWSNAPRIGTALLKSFFRRRSLSAHLLGLANSAVHRRHHRGPQSEVLQRPDADDGGPTRGADLVLELSGVLAGLQHHLRRSEHRLGRQHDRVLAGEPVQDPGIRHGLYDHVHERGRASGDPGDRVHLVFGDLHGEADRAEHLRDPLFLGIRYRGVADVAHRPLQNGAAVVGHDPDEPGLRREPPEGLHGHPGDHAYDGLALAGQPFREHVRDVLRLHRQEHDVRPLGDLFGGLIHLDPVLLAHPGAGLLRRRARYYLVLGEDPLGNQPRDEGLPHLARSYESDDHAIPPGRLRPSMPSGWMQRIYPMGR